jgi:hypothetical protein
MSKGMDKLLLKLGSDVNKLLKAGNVKFYMLLQFNYLEKDDPYVYHVSSASSYMDKLYEENKGKYLSKHLIGEISGFCPTAARVKIIPLTMSAGMINPCVLECQKEKENKPEME